MAIIDKDQVFAQALQQLNDKQRAAVEAIDGPVMVVAGPGTGKTELLAVRVGNILQKGIDIKPHNILCLTFTDAGAYAMRTRLLKYIGPDAYSVGIHTYHSFCNQVIQENLDYFGSYRDLQALSDLEKVEVMMEILETLPEDHLLKRFKGNIYYDQNNLANLFQTMKQENWTEEDFEEGLAKQKKRLLEDDSMYYKRKTTSGGKTYQKGDLKENAFNKEIEKYEKTLAAAKLLKKYDAILKEKERFDFQDMILWVLDKFSHNEELLARYQERFQYILLDEYQDTNGAQNELVFKLADFWEQPNLFAVGDDDQSIYRFQGANMNNITDFVEKYNPEIIVLDNNYRSDQSILDAAQSLIQNNIERLVQRIPQLTKNLIESRIRKEAPVPGPQVMVYQNPKQEEVGLVKKIKELVESGVSYKDIAIIYRTHREVEDLVKYFTIHKIPLNIKKKVNVLHLPMIKQLVNILKYIDGELQSPHSEEKRLFEILHYPYFGLYPVDIARISIYCSRYTDQKEDDRNWREVLYDEDKLKNLGLRDVVSISRISTIIESWFSASVSDTLQVLIEKIITSSKWLEYALNSENRTWHLQAFNGFFNLVKDESAVKEDFGLQDFLETINKMEINQLELPLIQTISNEKGINFVTAHSSKGLEFKYVFIIKVQAKNWVEKNYNRGFKYPYSLVPSSDVSDIEDDRRLFYVGMTRAEDGLYISYARTDHKEKESSEAQFVHETHISIPEHTIYISEDETIDYDAHIILHKEGKAVVIDHHQLEEVLKDFKVSATALNKYLRCPLTFYFENILRVPMARTASMGFGNAVHYALEYYFRDLDQKLPDGPVLPREDLLRLFEKGMARYHSHFTKMEYDNLSAYGKQVLSDYYDEYHTQWLSPRSYILEHVVDDVHCHGVPIKGKLDKLILYKDHIEVLDYKTGKYKAANLKPPMGDDDKGGDYWRQIVFYKLLIANDPKNPYNFGKGTMDFLEKDDRGNYQRKTLPVVALDEELVISQLTDSYEKIMKHEFEGCGEEDCRWCAFVGELASLESPLSEGLEEEH